MQAAAPAACGRAPAGRVGTGAGAGLSRAAPGGTGQWAAGSAPASGAASPAFGLRQGPLWRPASRLRGVEWFDASSGMPGQAPRGLWEVAAGRGSPCAGGKCPHSKPLLWSCVTCVSTAGPWKSPELQRIDQLFPENRLLHEVCPKKNTPGSSSQGPVRVWERSSYQWGPRWDCAEH